jgi:alkanesulfonate monooxygenase SsuD/methylene tetrahydromethanopterin reductase-like flavin-dependent oxidoreductase (luciferase family)
MRVENPARALALSFPNQMRKQGGKITEKFDWMKLIPRPGLQDEIAEELNEVDMDRALRTCVYGTPDDCIKTISEFMKAGVQHLILAPHGPYEDFFKLLGEKVLPYFRNG